MVGLSLIDVIGHFPITEGMSLNGFCFHVASAWQVPSGHLKVPTAPVDTMESYQI